MIYGQKYIFFQNAHAISKGGGISPKNGTREDVSHNTNDVKGWLILATNSDSIDCRVKMGLSPLIKKLALVATKSYYTNLTIILHDTRFGFVGTE